MTGPVLALTLLGCWNVVDIHEAPPPGDPSAYDPFANAAAVQAFAGEDAELLDINALKLPSSGKMDFDASYEPYTMYSFLRPTEGDPTKPIGAGGGARLEEVRVRVGQDGYMSIDSQGGPGPNVKASLYHRGMVEMGARTAKSKKKEDVVPLPSCSTADLWSKAIAEGAPKEAVAQLQYSDRGYQLRIADIGFRMQFDADCSPGRVRRD
jgi:hypothetical protein